MSKDENKIKFELILLAALFILSLFLLLGSTLAVFSDRAEDIVEANVGKIGVVLVEDFPETDEYGADVFEKNVRGLSVEDKNAYVRFKMVPVVEFYDSEKQEDGTYEWIWKIAPINSNQIQISYDGQDFIEKDGYWYYKKILKPQEETTDLNVEWRLSEVPLEMKEFQLRTNLRVILEYAQTTNNAWKAIFNIDSLPEGVEIE